MKECLALHERQREMEKNLQLMRDVVGVNPDGYVENEGYDEAKEKADAIKAHFMEECETDFEWQDMEGNFSLQDHEEIDLTSIAMVWSGAIRHP